MIKEYKTVKQFVDSFVSSHYLEAAVIVDEIFTDEYNALDVRVIGKDKLPIEFYFKFRDHVMRNHGKVVNDFEMISGVTQNQVSLLVYLRPIMEIRHNKINKIKSNILI